MPSLPLDKFRQAIIYLVTLILSICVHEFGHAFVADKLGDRLPRSQGRVTLNPFAHIDLLGTIIMPLLIVFTGAPLLGWGKPVQTNPLSYTRKIRMKTGHLLVAAAGPAMNLLFALLLSGLFVALIRSGQVSYHSPVFVLATGLIQLNIVLMCFNLIPLPPLDGGAVLAGLLPDQFEPILRPLNQYGGFILLALLFTGLLGTIMWPVSQLVRMWLEWLVRLAL